MDSSAPKTSRRLTNLRLASAFLSALLAACGTSGDSLREWTCTRADVPPDHEFLAGGGADSDGTSYFGTDSSKTAGGGDTYLSYWKQSIGDPPFETPNEVLCHVTKFEDEGAARAFVEGLSADDGLRGLPSFAWVPQDYTVAERIFIAPVGPRVFEIRVDDELRIIAAVQVVDRYVQSVLQGTSSGPPRTDIAAVIAVKLRERTERVAGLERE